MQVKYQMQNMNIKQCMMRVDMAELFILIGENKGKLLEEVVFDPEVQHRQANKSQKLVRGLVPLYPEA